MISIHAPREGGDVSPPSDCSKDAEFQSTPPVRGATWTSLARRTVRWGFQSTPPVRGATIIDAYDYLGDKISIHAPREGGDQR